MFQKFLSAFQKKAVGVSTPAALPLFGLAPTLTGKTVTTESALRVPAVACAVALIAETVSERPYRPPLRPARSAMVRQGQRHHRRRGRSDLDRGAGT